MRGLSISKAWDDSKEVLSRDGRLFVSVALCLVALPTMISGLVNPRGMDPSAPFWIAVVSLIASLIALAGQLALTRLALAPSITVGEAILHGTRRMPIYLLAAILILAGLFLIAIPIVFVLAAMGIPVEPSASNQIRMTPALSFAAIAYLVAICFIGVKMLMCAPAVTAEPIGPIAALRRSWELTKGHWWKLFGFVALFFIGAIVILYAVGAALGAVISLALGPVEPMSASALLVALVHSCINAGLTTVFAVMLARMYVQVAGRPDVEPGVPNTGI